MDREPAGCRWLGLDMCSLLTSMAPLVLSISGGFVHGWKTRR